MEAGGGEGKKIWKIRREGRKEGTFPRAIRAPLREGRRETRGRGRQWGGERPTQFPSLAYKNKIHHEYSGLRKGMHL